MTGPLVLIGGGEFTEGCAFDAGFIAASGTTEVVLLATGWAYENPGRAVETARAWFAGLGVSVREVPVYTRIDALDHDNVAAIEGASFIYLTGTSPMHIKSVLKDTPVFDAILKAWRNGAVLAGSNAGADVLCDPMVDTRGGAFTLGLGIASGVAVIARSNQWSPDKVRRTIDLASSNIVLVELPEHTALIYEDSGWRVEGKGAVVTHRDGKSVCLDELPAPN